MNWEEYLDKLIKAYRREYQKLDRKTKETVRKDLYELSLLEPCQIEVFDSVGEGRVVWLVVHDTNLPDRLFKVYKNVENLNQSKFVRRYPFFNKTDIEKTLTLPTYRDLEYIDIHMKERSYHFLYRDTLPENLSAALLRSVLKRVQEKIRKEQLLVIEKSAEELKDVSKIQADVLKASIRKELTGITEKIDKALEEIQRIDEHQRKLEDSQKDVGARQLPESGGKIFVSDSILKERSPVLKEVFVSEIKRLDQRIDDLKEIRFWSKRALVDIALAIIATASTTIAALLAAGIIH